MAGVVCVEGGGRGACVHARADVIRDPRFQKISYLVFPWMIFVKKMTSSCALVFVLQFYSMTIGGELGQYIVPLCLGGTSSEHGLSISNLILQLFIRDKSWTGHLFELY